MRGPGDVDWSTWGHLVDEDDTNLAIGEMKTLIKREDVGLQALVTHSSGADQTPIQPA